MNVDLAASRTRSGGLGAEGLLLLAVLGGVAMAACSSSKPRATETRTLYLGMTSEELKHEWPALSTPPRKLVTTDSPMHRHHLRWAPASAVAPT